MKLYNCLKCSFHIQKYSSIWSTSSHGSTKVSPILPCNISCPVFTLMNVVLHSSIDVGAQIASMIGSNKNRWWRGLVAVIQSASYLVRFKSVRLPAFGSGSSSVETVVVVVEYIFCMGDTNATVTHIPFSLSEKIIFVEPFQKPYEWELLKEIIW